MIQDTIRHKGQLYINPKGLTWAEMIGAIQTAMALVQYLDEAYLDTPQAAGDEKLHRLYSDFHGALDNASRALRSIMEAGR